jgi:hypothetical protein
MSNTKVFDCKNFLSDEGATKIIKEELNTLYLAI